MKLYTDLEQSRKLAEILPLESADMFWYRDAVTTEVNPRIMNCMQIPELQSMYYSPCWSLAALLGVLPKHIGGSVLIMDMTEKDFNLWFNDLSSIVDKPLPDITKDNPIDACYEMIIKLHELNLL